MIPPIYSNDKIINDEKVNLLFNSFIVSSDNNIIIFFLQIMEYIFSPNIRKKDILLMVMLKLFFGI